MGGEPGDSTSRELAAALRRQQAANAVLAGIARIFREALTCETEEALGRVCLAVAEEVTQSRFGFVGEIDRATGKVDDIAISDPGWGYCTIAQPAGHGSSGPPTGFAVHGVYGRVLLDGKAFFTNDPAAHPDSVGTPPGHPPLKAFLGVPLAHAGKTLGILALANREGGYGPEELESAEALAPAIVQAILGKRAEAALRDSERKYSVLFDRSPFAMAVTRKRDGAIVSVNDAFLRLFEYERGEVLGKTTLELGIADAASRERVRAELLSRGCVRDMEVVRTAKSGAQRILALQLDTVTIGGGDFVLTTMRDVTARKRTEEALRASEQRLAAHLDNSPLAVVEFDPEYRVTRWSKQAERVFGWTAEEMVGRAIPGMGWIPEDDAESVAREWAGLLSGERPRSVHVNRNFRKDGALIHCEWYNSAIYGPCGRLLSVLSQVLDVTARKQGEDELRESDRRKNEFLAVLSHELRNPLAPMMNSLHLLDRAPAASEQAARARAILRRQTGHLARLVDDLLDVTRISRGKIELQRARLDAHDVVRRTCDDHRALFRERGLELRVEASDPAWIEADETRVAQVLGNLLHNAAKFSAPGSAVTVSIGRGEGRATIHVRDEGIGIAPDLLARLFQPFVQADGGLARTKGGLGLGLALVKGLVELHGGSVHAHSGGVGCGAEFVVELPLAPAAGSEG